MTDGSAVYALNGRRHGGPVPHIAAHPINPAHRAVQVPGPSRGQVVEHAHPLAGGQQPVHKVRTDEACPTRHQDMHVTTSSLRYHSLLAEIPIPGTAVNWISTDTIHSSSCLTPLPRSYPGSTPPRMPNRRQSTL
jgi:hypothetical protein